MQSEVIMAGFGGQGILLIGKMLAYAGMHEGKEVSWLPSYGPEMRGGTCNCTVVVSDKPVGSPVFRSPRAVLAMNLPSLDKYEDAVEPGGYIAVNTSLVNRKVKRTDINVIEIPANKIAEDIGNVRFSNIVMLGGLASKADFLNLKSLEKGLKHGLSGKKAAFLEANMTALHEGAEYTG